MPILTAPRLATAAMVAATATVLVVACTSSPSSGPAGTTTATTTARPANLAGRSILQLPRVPWYGGPAYYSKFSKATASGWTSPSHFPIGVWFGKPSHAGALAGVGVNTYVGAEHDGSPITDITNQGIDVIAQGEWTQAELGTNPDVVGWLVSDECDQGLDICSAGSDEYGDLKIQTDAANKLRALHDGRFLQANFGNGILGTYWSAHTMADQVGLMDVSSVDKYAYTSPDADSTLASSSRDCCWPAGKNPETAGAYGYVMDRLQHYSHSTKPAWAIVETARPLLTDPGARTIQPPQIEGAVWNAIIHGASGIIYFQHNNDPSCGMYSLVECSQALKDKVRAIDTEVTSLAPVINTQSYQWNFGPDLETALKVSDGHAYILAMTSGGTGSRTFTLPVGLTGDVTVVGENRTLDVSNGRFTDTFPDEYTHHIYEIAVGRRPSHS